MAVLKVVVQSEGYCESYQPGHRWETWEGQVKLPGGGTALPDSTTEVYIRPREGAYCG